MELKNKMNGEIYHCDDRRLTEIIDGVEYLLVQKPYSDRKFLFRKDVLEKVSTNKTSQVKRKKS